MKRTLSLLGAVAGVIAGATALTSIHETPRITASSHREAPLISNDPEADGTDLFVFRSPDRPDTLTFIMNYSPLEAPDGGPNFYKFGDDVLYSLHVDNNGDAEEDITYEWRFRSETRNPNTFLYNTGAVNAIDDPNLNVRQFYSVTRIDRGREPRVLIDNVPVAPHNVGKRSFPDYDKVANEANVEVPNTGGARIFAGPRDDPFWVDLAVFDLLGLGRGVDSLAGYNVHTIALQASIARFTSGSMAPSAATDPNAVIGVWMTASRPSTRIFNEDGTQVNDGPMVQVSRLGAPLVNEVVVPRGFKDLFNASHPRDDARFLSGVTDPELAKLFNAVLNFPAPTTNRTDLVQVFLTGVPGATMPPNVKPAEMLRLNVAVPPSASPNRLGVVGGDLGGFPNGRRLADDVVDIELQAVGGVLQNVPGAAALSQGVPFNDKPFLNTFPYAASPHPGNK